MKLHLATATLLKFLLKHTKIILSKYQNRTNQSQGIRKKQGSWEALLFVTFHLFRPQWNTIWQVRESLTGQHALLWLLWFLLHRLHYLVYYIIVNYKDNCCLAPLISQICQGKKGAHCYVTNNRSATMGSLSSSAPDDWQATELYHTP